MILNISWLLSHRILTTVLGDRSSYLFLHFLNEQTQGQAAQVIFSKVTLFPKDRTGI